MNTLTKTDRYRLTDNMGSKYLTDAEKEQIVATAKSLRSGNKLNKYAGSIITVYYRGDWHPIHRYEKLIDFLFESIWLRQNFEMFLNVDHQITIKLES